MLLTELMLDKLHVPEQDIGEVIVLTEIMTMEEVLVAYI